MNTQQQERMLRLVEIDTEDGHDIYSRAHVIAELGQDHRWIKGENCPEKEE